MHKKNEPFDISSERIKTYENATEMLMQRVSAIKLPDDASNKFNMCDTVKKFRDAFKLPQLRATVLVPRHEASRIAMANFSAGFCGIASYAWHHMFRLKSGAPIWQMYYYSNIGNGRRLMNHVWLKNIYDGSILDLTFDQSIDSHGIFIEIPYELGKPIDGNFAFKRAIKFGEYINVDLQKIAFQNALRGHKDGFAYGQ